MRDTLKPLLLILATAFACGSPYFDAVRPQALDEPLRGFHSDATATGRAGLRAVRAVAAADPFELLATGGLSGRLLGDAARSVRRVSGGP